MIRAVAIALVIAAAVLLQTALMPHLSIAGFRPDLLLLVTVLFALRDGPLTGTAVAFASGLLGDLLLVESPLGLYTLVLLVTGYAVGVVRPWIPSGSVTAPVAAAFVTGVVSTAGYGTLARLLGDPRFTFELVFEAAVLVGLYNTLLAPPAAAALGALSLRFPPERAAPV